LEKLLDLSFDVTRLPFDAYRERERERERESRFLTAHQHKTGHSVPIEVKIKAIWIIR